MFALVFWEYVVCDFESYSQLTIRGSFFVNCCSEYQRYKLLKAIHNWSYWQREWPEVVQNIKDTNFWKQFTTGTLRSNRGVLLFRISKIQTFESNSQLWYIVDFRLYVVQNIKDTNFWKQFTTGSCVFKSAAMLFRISKIQTFESNSQLFHRNISWLGVVQNIKDTNFWKQFTTPSNHSVAIQLLFRISKIQTFESNSQLFFKFNIVINSCSEYQRYKLLKAIHNNHVYNLLLEVVVQNIKDTNFWKQFTTICRQQKKEVGLFRISKIQTFESNSQRHSHVFNCFHSCSEYQRYKLLKAIHNLKWNVKISNSVVQNIKDTNFWKQFTTINWISFDLIWQLRAKYLNL